jgi:UDP-glucose 4-epimerase
MNCLVTGGLGFIGSHLVKALRDQNHTVFVVDDLSCGRKDRIIESVEYQIKSLLDEDYLVAYVKKIQPQWVFHLAAWPQIQPSFEDPRLYDHVNVHAGLMLMKALKEAKAPVKAFVNSCSSAIYGNPQKLPIPETQPIDPLSPYALQKYSSEAYLKILGERSGIPVVSLRYFNVYGPGSFDPESRQSAYSSVIGIFKNQIQSGNPLTVTGDGKQTRDFVHISDVVQANLLVAEKIQQTCFQSFNVGTGVETSVVQLAQLFGGSIQWVAERKGEIRSSVADIAKLKELGWSPKVKLAQAIEKGMI